MKTVVLKACAEQEFFQRGRALARLADAGEAAARGTHGEFRGAV